MRTLLTFVIATMLAAGVSGQLPDLKTPVVQRVRVEPGMVPASVVPGGTLTLWADVTPQANIHVYASGAKGFTPVALSIVPRASLKISDPMYPPSRLLPTVGVDELVPVYDKTFRIRQPVVIEKTAKHGEKIEVRGVLTYQACDDRMCYASASTGVTWTVAVK